MTIQKRNWEVEIVPGSKFNDKKSDVEIFLQQQELESMVKYL